MLEYIFNKYFDRRNPQKTITFYLSDIAEGYRFCKIAEPVSISNTILDLCRQDRGINSRVPDSISAQGYDLRKKTGQDSSGKKYAGEFVHVGVGNSLTSWLIWPEDIELIEIDSGVIPEIVKRLIRPDEGGLFSIMDYTDILSKVIFNNSTKVIRIQNPMKWQPNEIDGFYACQVNGRLIMYPIEAKSKVTQDDINLDQLKGGYNTCRSRLSDVGSDADIQQLAVRMISNGIDIAIFPLNTVPIEPERCVRVVFRPALVNWT